MRHVLIINPSAGRKKSAKDLLDRAEAAFDGDFEAYFTEKAGDARELSLRAIEKGGPLRLYACGGDGTLNEVVNAAAGVPGVAVTNVPMGTGNDFLRLFGKEGREKFRDLSALRDGPEMTCDLMDCNGMLGLDVICAGIDARVAAEVDRYKRLPLVTGVGAYILSLAVNVFKGLTVPMTVDMGDIHYTGPVTILCVCNGQHYGGGFRPVPEADPTDGVLDMLLIGDLTLLQFARYVGLYAKGGYKQVPEIVKACHGRAVTFSSDRELTAVVDGETLRSKSFTLRLSEKKVSFFRPVGVELPAEISTPVGSL